MSSEYRYDTDAEFFPSFVLTLTSLVTIPLTYTLLRAPSDATIDSKATKIASSYQPDNVDIIDAQRSKQKRKELRFKRILTAAAGWLIMAAMIYLMAITPRTVSKRWDPFEILGLPESASDKDISRKYKRLSVTLHPDKRVPDPAKNETMETVNDYWVEVVKAYKALTDEDVRRNFIEFGHPDGKQSTSFGIALPQFLVAEGSGKYVLIFYGALLGIGLPWLVGQWWYGMQKLTKEKILVTSAGNMFKEFKDRMAQADVVTAVSSAAEWNDILSGGKADSGLGKLEKKLLNSGSGEPSLPAQTKTKLAELEDPVRRKTLALLWAYLNRVELDDKTLEAEKYEVVPTALQLNDAFLSVCLAYGFTAPLMASYRLNQSLTQAVSPSLGCPPLMQLPRFSPKVVQSIEASAPSNRPHLSLESFMALPAEQRRSLAKAAGLSKDHLSVAEGVARQMPHLKIEKTFFKVQGERHIIPGSLVQFVIKARFIPPGTENVPAINDKDLLDIDPSEGDIQAQKQEPEQHPVPLAYAPFLPQDRAPKWHVFLADTRQGKMAVPPFTFTAFDKQPFDEAGKPTFNGVTLKMQFQCPPQEGEYRFQMHMVCDSYIGFDAQRDVSLFVEDASKARVVDEEDDISEPEEDSIAGQMAALKGQPTADPDKPKRQRKVAPKASDEDRESDYESGTDDDEDVASESESETDTDTDSDEE